MMMEVTGNKTNLKELVEQATEHLVSLKYLPDSVKQYRRIWEKLKNYSQEKGAEYFSITLGHEFLEYQYGLIVGKETKKVDHVRSRAIRILSDYQQNGAIIKKIGKKTEPFPQQFESLFLAYVQTLKTEERPNSRIQTETLHLRYFGSYLEQECIKQFFQVRGGDITGFVQTLTCFAKNENTFCLYP